MAWLSEHSDERIVATTEVAFAVAEQTAELAAADPLVGSWASHIVPESEAYATLCAQVDVSGTGIVERVDHRGLLRGPITVTTSFIAEAQLLRIAGGFAPHALAMDDYWLLVNAARLCPIAKLDQPTVFYRVHAHATSRTTRLALPFLSSSVALLLGGGLVPMTEGLARASAGSLQEHLLDELIRSEEYHDPRVREAARHLAALLWRGGRRSELLKGELRSQAPWLASALRRVRPGRQE